MPRRSPFKRLFGSLWRRRGGDTQPRFEDLPGLPYDPALPCCRQVDLDHKERHFLAVWGDHLSVHDVADGRRAARDFFPEEGVRRARFAPDGERVALGTRDDRALLLDWRRTTVLARSDRLGDYLDEVRWLPDGGEVVGATQSNEVLVQDGDDLRTVRRLLPGNEGGHEPFGGMALSPDGRRVFLVSGGRVRCLDADTGEALWEITPGRPCLNPALSPDGSRLALASDHGVTLVDAATGVIIAETRCFRFQGIRFPGIDREGLAWSPCLAFSPDGAWLAASTPNGQLMLLDPATLDVLREYPRLEPGPAWIEDLAWFSDATRLLLGCAHDRLLVWSVDGERCLLETPLSS
jgi:WD40 repeat protein